MHTAVLAKITRHISLTPAEADHFVALLVSRRVARFEYLLQTGEPTRYLLVVVRGCVRTHTIDNQAKEYVLAFATEGW